MAYASKPAVILIYTGSPSEPRPEEVKAFLKRFLGDPRVVDLPRWQWLPILHGIILRVRPPKSAARYAEVWTDEGAPLTVWTRRQRDAIQERLDGSGHDVPVRTAAIYSDPDVREVVGGLVRDGYDHLIALPMNPQYASVTNGAMAVALMDALREQVRIPKLTFIDSFCHDGAYLDALADSVRRSGWTWKGDDTSKLITTYHSTLVKDIEAGDVYQDQCRAISEGLASRLDLPAEAVVTGYQCVFDKRPWLHPLTAEEVLPKLVSQGVTDVCVIAPGFVTECLETKDDIDDEQRQVFASLCPQGSFTYVPCLGDDPAFMDALTGIIKAELR